MNPAEKQPGTQKTGRVIQSTGRRCKVQTEGQDIYECAVRGKFRIQGQKTTHPIAVGDRVNFLLPAPPEKLGLVMEVLPRKNYISRKAIAQTHREHVLCANIDQALLVFTVDHPVTSFGFADRFLLICTVFDIPTRIILNKVDLLTSPEQQEKMDVVRQTYQALPC